MRRTLFFLLSLFLFVGVGWSQKKTITVSGIVISSADKEPVIAASVACVEFPTTGTLTDVKGHFTLKLPNAAKQLVISCIGYNRLQIPITSGEMKIVLKAEEQLIKDVVITGYGNTRKSAFAGSATTISTKSMKDVPTVSLEDKLTGAIAGVAVNSTSGQPGSIATVRIRGLGSINAGSDPLYVIDGVPVNNSSASIFSYAKGGMSPLSTINSNDIENITVIKDAGAAALYGSRAANGVVVITTKSGRAGKTRYNFKADWGSSDMAINYRPTLGAEQRNELIRHGYTKYYSELRDPHTGQLLYPNASDVQMQVDKRISSAIAKPWSGYTDWRKVLLRRGASQNYEFSISGGGEKTKFYTSVSYADQKGISLASDFNRLTGSFNVSHTDRRLQLKARMLFAKTQQHTNMEGSAFANPIFGISTTLTPSNYPFKEDGSYNRSFSGNYNINPLFSTTQDFSETKLVRVYPSIEATLTLFPGLKLRQNVSYDYTNSEEGVFWDPRGGNGESDNGVFQRSNLERATLTTQSQLYANHDFDKHQLSGVASFESESFDQLNIHTRGSDFPYYLKYEINNAGKTSGKTSVDRTRMLSFLLKGDYSYDGRYILGASARWDGSSRLAPEHRWGLFWSLSGSWNIDKEDFMKELEPVLTDTRLRLSYGANGTLPYNFYDHLSLYSFGYNYNGGTGTSESGLGSPNLSWEKNKAFNLGLDFRLFNRLGVTLDYYNRLTTDLLLYKSISGTVGFGSELQNVGSMRNTGIELELRSTNLSLNNFSWSTTLSLGHNKNTLLRFDGVQTTRVEGTWVHEVGHPYNAYYLAEYAGVDPQTGKAQYYSNEYKNGNYSRTLVTDGSKAQRRRIDDKPFDPVLTGGLINNINWGPVDINFTLSYSLGGYLYDNAVALYKDGNEEVLNLAIPTYYDINKIWKKVGDKAELPSFEPTNTYTYSTRFLRSTDHLRLKNFTIGFTAPKSWTNKVGVTTLRLYASGNNLLTWKDKLLVVDPEQRGFVTFGTPPLRTVTFGLQVGI